MNLSRLKFSTQITKSPDCPQKSFLVVPDHLCNSDMFGHTEIRDADGVQWCKIFIFSPCPDMRRPSVVRVCSPHSMAFYSHREKVALVNTRTCKPFVTVCPCTSLGLHASFVNIQLNPGLKKVQVRYLHIQLSVVQGHFNISLGENTICLLTL